MFNDMIADKMDAIENDVKMLKRIDIRMNKELVSKPYLYIDGVKDALDKEQREIVKIVKANNDKYI